MPRCILLTFLLLGVLWTYWICDWVSDINLGKILHHYFFKYYFCSFPFLFSWCHDIYVTLFGVVPEFLNILFWVFGFCFILSVFFFSWIFVFGRFYWHILKFRDYFLNCDESIESVLYVTSLLCWWYCCFFFLSLAFLFNSFLDLSPLCLHYLSILAFVSFHESS